MAEASGEHLGWAGPGHRWKRQMLGAPPIHRGAKMNEGFKKCYSQFYFNTIHLKCYTKSDRPTKTTILLLSSVQRMIFPRTYSRTSTNTSYLIVKDVHL